MSLSFLVPAFFVGLLALAVPLLIHLTRRQVHDPVHFPSLMFLRRVPEQTRSRRRIHRWPLLLLRALALSLLVLAFTRPFLARSDGSALLVGEGSREVVILLDRSYSMGMGGRWAEALALGNEAIAGLEAGDRGTLVLFDAGAEAPSESTSDPGVLSGLLRRAEPGLGTTRYAPALRYASRILSGSTLPRHELVIISDFQRAAWDRDAGESRSLRFPMGTRMTLLPVSDHVEIGNATLLDVAFERSNAADRERVEIQAQVSRTGPGLAELPVRLEVEGRTIETRAAEFDEGGIATVRFNPLTLPPAGSTRGTLRLPDDALAADNEFHFVLSSDQRLPVLILNGPGVPAGGSLFLERALSIGNTPGFRVEVRRSEELQSGDLERARVVILNQASLPSGALGVRLRERVEEGMGLVMVLGDAAPGEWPGIVPGALSSVDRSAGGGTAIGYVDTGHPIFEPFSGPRSGDFGAARVYRYRALASGSGLRTLARFGDGGGALVERPVGEGRLLVWSSTLDPSWSDLALQPIFLPFIQQLARYAAGYAPARSWHTIGEPLHPGMASDGIEEFSIALAPSGAQLRLESGSPLTLMEQGFYELRDPRAAGGAAVVAVNIDPLEAELTRFDPEEMRSALVAAAREPGGGGVGGEVALAERERQQSSWWYLIIAVFLLLVGETFFSNRRERSRSSGVRAEPAGAAGAAGTEERRPSWSA